MADEIGIAKHTPKTYTKTQWNYKSLKYAPPEASGYENWVTSIYRGLVPAKNIERRDFAIAGAFVSPSIFTSTPQKKKFTDYLLIIGRSEFWLYSRSSCTLDFVLLPK